MTIQSKIATIGWYYDAFQSSFSDAKLHGFVDHLAALGYTGITYRFNVNVAKSGEVLNTYKQDRLDQIIAYTQSKGMGVNLVTNWVYDGTQDIVGTGWPSIPTGFDTAKFLAGVAQYFKSAAAHFEAVKAETLFVGFENYPFVTSEFHSQWAAIIADIKTKYHGIVSYMSDTNWWPMTNVGIWDLVDKIGLLVNPNMGNAAPTSVQQVEQFYFQNPVDGSNTVKDLIELSKNAITAMEIGFNAGHSAEVFLKNNSNLRLTSFDVNHHSYVSTGKEYMDLFFPNRHTLILGDSVVTVPEYTNNNPGKVYDIIFIDGCHEYHVATADLENCRKLANNQTIVILDDTVFTEEGLNYGATRAWLTQVNNGKIREEGRVLYEGTRGMAWGKYIF